MTRTFVEPLQECLLRSLVLLQQDPEDMVWLFPTVQRLLELLSSLEQQHINHTWICHKASSLESLANGVSDL